MFTDSISNSMVLVTGASGHLGANLVRRLLSDGIRVKVLIHPDHNNEAVAGLEVETVHADIRDRVQTVKALAGSDYVFHCAAMVSTIDGNARHRREIFDTNVIGTRNVMNAALEHKVRRVVATGSFSAVGINIDNPSAPSNEDMMFYPYHRTMPYEQSKVLMEHECLKAAANGLDVVIATCCAIIGGNDYLPSRLGRTLCDYANGRLRFYIDGGFEFVTARDIVTGHLLCMEKGRSGRKYIFSSGYLTLTEVLDLFAGVTGVPMTIRKLPGAPMYPIAEVASFILSRVAPQYPQRFTPGAIRLLLKRRHADITRARSELGYEPTAFREAVQEAYDFHDKRGSILKRNAG